jgi:hypothetical protein
MVRRFLYPCHGIKKNGYIAANPDGFWEIFVKRRGANPDKIRVGSNEDLGSLVTLVPIRCYGHHELADPLVGVIMGSDSARMPILYERTIVLAHRAADRPTE